MDRWDSSPARRLADALNHEFEGSDGFDGVDGVDEVDEQDDYGGQRRHGAHSEPFDDGLADVHRPDLEQAGVHAVALTWVDVAGITRVKTVPLSRFHRAAERGVGMSPVFDVYLVDDSVTTSRHIGGPDGDLRLRPDPDRLTVLAGQPGWAWAPVDRYHQDGRPYEACQRLFARRMVRRAAEQGIELRMGYETEWVVSRDGAPACTGPAYGMARVVELSAYLDDLHTSLRTQGLDVLQLHPEYSQGQFEVSLAPTDPVGAADEAVLVRETIRAVSLRHGLTASFGPAIDADSVGNGRHLHLSLWRDGRNLCGDGGGPFGMTSQCEAFLSGVLYALPGLLALGAPSPASYLRLQPSRWAGAYRCWGLENREAALRFIAGQPGELGEPSTTREPGGPSTTGEPKIPGAANAEIKCFDPAANPYLVVGAVIAAGLAGLDAQLALPAPVSGDPVRQDKDRLPTSLTEAVAAFSSSTVLREALGDALSDAVIAVRTAEVKLFDGVPAQALAEATRNRY
ncbi:glutamine synthetase [Streptomyces sp. YC504]|uniref:Glutamine synthetase n=1 Tax=Streptomyces mesophilus TaxID=1775132 RepID=A0A6G4XPT7_9ACTN|nr:glutamine synthetase family protein [Streptomyces mesophilus]NGO78621.1 glutamine synthetase [Streptomyces mesophilus]